MFLQIELLYLVLMLGIFIALVVAAKMPAGLALIISSIVGMLASTIFSKTEFAIRHLIEGGISYFDPILLVATAMIFMVALQSSGCLDYLSNVILKTFRKVPSIMLIAFMLIIMFPGMITGSTLASIITAGALVAPIMIKLGIPRAKVGAIVAFGAIFGEISPPVNIPAMLIAEAVDMPYIGFTLPLLAITIPLAITTVLILGRPHLKKLSLEEVEEIIDCDKTENVKWHVTLPIILLAVLILLQNIFPQQFGILGMPLIFIISTIPTFFVGKKFNIINASKEGVSRSLPAMLLLIGVGVFVQAIALNGVRGYIVINVLSLPTFLRYFGMAVFVPALGGVSAFASASVFGAPFVMALLKNNVIVVAAGLSMLAAAGELLPPTATGAAFAATVVEEENYLKITKAGLIPLFITIVYSVIFVILISSVWR